MSGTTCGSLRSVLKRLEVFKKFVSDLQVFIIRSLIWIRWTTYWRLHHKINEHIRSGRCTTGSRLEARLELESRVFLISFEPNDSKSLALMTGSLLFSLETLSCCNSLLVSTATAVPFTRHRHRMRPEAASRHRTVSWQVEIDDATHSIVFAWIFWIKIFSLWKMSFSLKFLEIKNLKSAIKPPENIESCG